MTGECQIVPIRRVGPFADAALDLYRHGLAILPVGGDDGKVPLIQWGRWQKPIGLAYIEKLLESFGTANIGIVCDLSKVTIVDIDTKGLTEAEVERLVATMIARCGDTPLKTRTPSGGVHLWYRHNGERCTNLRHDEGLPVDVKGAGGFVVVPPSIRPTGDHAGKPYEFRAGTWTDLKRLPIARPNSLNARAVSKVVGEGRRDDWLFDQLRRHAQFCDTEAALLDVAQGLNATHCSPPLPDKAVAAKVKSVWRYVEGGTLFKQGQEAVVIMRLNELNILGHNSDALNLWCHLKVYHGSNSAPFAISAKSMAKARVVPDLKDARRISKATRFLVSHHLLKLTHKGGARPGDVSLFTLTSLFKTMGAEMRPKIKQHPSPSPIGPGPSKQADQAVDGNFVAPMFDPKEFGRVIRQARARMGLSQAEAGRLAGMARSTFTNYENGRFSPGPASMRRMAEAVGLTVAA